MDFQSIPLTATSPYAGTVSNKPDTYANDAYGSTNAIPQTNTVQQIRRIFELPHDLHIYVTNHLGSVAITGLNNTDSHLGASLNRLNSANVTGAN